MSFSIVNGSGATTTSYDVETALAGNQVHIRFFSMLNKDFYIHLSDASRDLAETYEVYKSLMEKDEIRCRDSNANHENSEQINSQTRIKNAIKEKEIFMRASLQLLDQKSTFLLQNMALNGQGITGGQGNNHSNAQPNLSFVSQSDKFISYHSETAPHYIYNNRGSSQSTATSSISSQTTRVGNDNNMHDVIRLGYLKKASRTGGISMGTGANLWKRKYVELRHGLFTYDDYHSNHYHHNHHNSSSGNNNGSVNTDIEELTRNEQYVSHNRRSIALNVHSCICRISTSSSNDAQTSRVFEIVVSGGPKRQWKASTHEECKEWVRAIRSAMIGGKYIPGSFKSDMNELSSSMELSFPIGPSRNSVSDFSMSSSVAFTSNNGNDLNRLALSMAAAALSPPPDDSDDCFLWSSIDGAAAPYVFDMSTFLQLQTAILSIDEEREYRDLLQDLYLQRVKLTIPVLFVKSKALNSTFSLSSQDNLNYKAMHAKSTSQVWKDLNRDVIVVNGEVVSGELGAETMLGALVRHIAEKAEIIKLHNTRHTRNSDPSRKPMGASSSSSSSFGPMSLHDFDEASPFMSELTLNEAQIMEFAKDLLVLCNRTQSGGDTYFCIEALLAADKSKGLSILTPYSPEAEPLEFKVDIVKIDQQIAPIRNRAFAQSDFPSMIGSSSSAHRSVGREATAMATEVDSFHQIANGVARDDFTRASGDSIELDTHASSSSSSYEPEIDKPSYNSSIAPSIRRPQLDLRKDLEQGGYLSKWKNASSPSNRPSHHGIKSIQMKNRELPPLLPSARDRDAASAHNVSNSNIAMEKAESDDSPQMLSPPRDIPHEVISSSRRPNSPQKDDASVISELTFDTTLRNIYHGKQMPSSTDPASENDNQSSDSGDDEEDEGSAACLEHDGDGLLDADDPAAVAGKGKGKGSILKRISRKLKPFKLSDGFDNLKSPFRRKKNGNKDKEEENNVSRRNSHQQAATESQQGQGGLESKRSSFSHETAADQRSLQKPFSAKLCIRVQVRASSQYRVCSGNPVGIEKLDTWATVSGTFYQSFLLVGDGSYNLGLTDRVVTMQLEDYNPMEEAILDVSF